MPEGYLGFWLGKLHEDDVVFEDSDDNVIMTPREYAQWFESTIN